MFPSFLKKFDSRKIKWISSKTGDQKVLASLDKKMEYYYSTADGREVYQQMVDSENNKQESTDNIGIDLIEYIATKRTTPLKIIEIECGRGNIYKRLRSKVPECDFHGVEVAPYIIELNKLDFPEASWSIG